MEKELLFPCIYIYIYIFRKHKAVYFNLVNSKDELCQNDNCLVAFIVSYDAVHVEANKVFNYTYCSFIRLDITSLFFMIKGVI